MLKNYMEVLVDEIYSEVQSIYKDCKTEKCVEDIKSVALNNLPPMYFSNNIDEGTKKAFLLERQRRITVLAKVPEAADIVCANCKNKT